MTIFRPCIDLHHGLVKQIVGATLRDNDDSLVTNGVSDQPASYFAALYRDDGLRGGHMIMLGPGNEAAARDALAAYPGGLQIGGGITAENAEQWLDAGAAAVIVTSYIFRDGALDQERLKRVSRAVGRERLVIDLSCRQQGDPKGITEGRRATEGRSATEGRPYTVMMERWQRWTDFVVSREALAFLADFCGEFLVHAIASEGRGEGIEEELVVQLGAWSPIPVTYAGGARSIDDLALVERLSDGRVDLTIGSALDLFGGTGVGYADAVAFNRQKQVKQ